MTDRRRDGAIDGWFVYVGATTGAGRAEGISVFHLDGTSEALTHRQTVPGLPNPTYLTLHPRQPLLYAAIRPSGGGVPQEPQEGSIVGFGIDPAAGTLTEVCRQPSGGPSPAYVHVHPDGDCLLVANLGNGTVAALPVRPDGTLAPASDVVHHEGSGPVAPRQTGPHTHMITSDPSGVFALACDLGIDRVMIYRLERRRSPGPSRSLGPMAGPGTLDRWRDREPWPGTGPAGRLAAAGQAYAQLSSGAGPRHLACHPAGHFVYVLGELDSGVTVFAFDPAGGTMRVVQWVSVLPDGFDDHNQPAQILVHPGGRFLYTSNRGHDSISIFAIEQDGGRLRLLGHEPTQGRSPRNFALDPTGRWLLAANEGSNSLVLFRVDQRTGRLTATGQVAHTPAPTCVAFRPSDS